MIPVNSSNFSLSESWTDPNDLTAVYISIAGVAVAALALLFNYSKRKLVPADKISDLPLPAELKTKIFQMIVITPEDAANLSLVCKGFATHESLTPDSGEPRQCPWEAYACNRGYKRIDTFTWYETCKFYTEYDRIKKISNKYDRTNAIDKMIFDDYKLSKKKLPPDIVEELIGHISSELRCLYYEELVSILIKQELFDKAEKIIDKISDHPYPYKINSQLNLVRALINQDLFDKAEKIIDKISDHSYPYKINSQLNLVRALINQDLFDKAEKIIDKISDHPYKTNSQLNLACALIEKDQLERAEEIIEKLDAKMPPPYDKLSEELKTIILRLKQGDCLRTLLQNIWDIQHVLRYR